ncbi:Wzz/FepE/Etk N-terminal domain-containing protein, partial [Chitinophaga sp. RAB17]|uniref:Wzz/FepE/Etk N-terminal domain-containing protein n=1 Tax=Chitinophaga sp. RAB17 TaxID=3233049 RepID=UPI003F8E7F5E
MGYSEDTIDHTEDKPDVSFRDFLLKLSDWFSFLWKRKWIIILFGVIGAGLGLTAALIKAKEYEAQLSFVLEDSNAGGLGAYAGFASQFGLDITGGAS